MISGYDQWKTASPYDDDTDPIEDAENVIKEVRWALMNWETQPGPWKSHITKLIETVEMLTDYISENI